MELLLKFIEATCLASSLIYTDINRDAWSVSWFDSDLLSLLFLEKKQRDVIKSLASCDQGYLIVVYVLHC